MLPLNRDLAGTFSPPVMEARRWLEGFVPTEAMPLINVSQAAPVDPPPEGLRRALAEAAMNNPQAHLYGPVLGLPDLREAVATRWSLAYNGKISGANVAITQGCNQAFCATITSIASAGDEIILPVPWYFNYKMWLDMQGYGCVPLACGTDMLPDPAQAKKLVTPRTKAIVLITPNNPSGAEYPAELLVQFRDLARRKGIALILDETYRDFDSREGAPHDLFTDPDWGDVLIQLYSFSKAFRLTGHRVGAIVAAESHLHQIEKVLDTMAICAPQMGQLGALWGLENLDDWLAGEREEVLRRSGAMRTAMQDLEGWNLKGCGAYFAWVQHPFAEASDVIAQQLVKEAGVLLLPGTMFMPADDPQAAGHMRIAFANIDVTGIAKLAERLRHFSKARL